MQEDISIAVFWIPRPRTKFMKKTFKKSGNVLWNSIPVEKKNKYRENNSNKIFKDKYVNKM